MSEKNQQQLLELLRQSKELNEKLTKALTNEPEGVVDKTPIVLPGDCPGGLIPCDPQKMSKIGAMCPPITDDTAPIYNSDGNRCITRDEIIKNNEFILANISSSEKRKITQNVRALVLAAAKILAKLNDLGHANTQCSDVESMFVTGEGESEEVVKSRRRAFCGTLLKKDGTKKCNWSKDDNTCAEVQQQPPLQEEDEEDEEEGEEEEEDAVEDE